MEVIETIILSLVQGLTEFIPVSSSGHVALGQFIFSGQPVHLFIEFIHIGTLFSLLVYYRRKIILITKQVIFKREFILARNVFLGALPAGIAGIVLGDFIRGITLFGGVVIVTIALALVGVIMVVLERLPRASEVDNLGQLSWPRALTIGVVQLLAFIPGVSRSGSTIVSGRVAGLTSADAAEFSFLVSIPLMAGLAIKLFVFEGDKQYFIDNIATLVLGNIVAFIAGLMAIGFLIRYLQNNSLAVFGWYRIGLAAVVAVTLLLV